VNAEDFKQLIHNRVFLDFFDKSTKRIEKELEQTNFSSVEQMIA
jgi:nucleoid-associated protein YejK